MGLRGPRPAPRSAGRRMSPVIAVTDTAVGDDGLERALAEETGAEFRAAGELGAALDGADVVFTNFAPLGPGELGRLAAGAVVIRYGVGVDNVDLAAAAGAGVRVCNVPDYGANVVADHAVMLAAMLVRRVRDFDAALHRGEEPDPRRLRPDPEPREPDRRARRRRADRPADRRALPRLRLPHARLRPVRRRRRPGRAGDRARPLGAAARRQRHHLAPRAAHRRHPPPARRRRVRRDAPRRARRQHGPRRARRLRRARPGAGRRASSPAPRST